MMRLMPIRFAPALAVLILALGISPSAVPAQTRIVGGEPTTNPWPAQAQLTVLQSGKAQHECGGTLVSPRWVLTAAHCVTNGAGAVLDPGIFTVTMGSTKIDGNGGTDHAVTQIVKNPSYNSKTHANDAALLRLLNPSHATPMALISNDSLDAASPGSIARVLGWGTTSEGGDLSVDLRQVDVPIVDDDTCSDSYGAEFISSVMLCAGLPEGGKDSCQGDSGGPLLVQTGTGTTTGSNSSEESWKLAGIVSWGDGCAEPDRYGIYTRLANVSIRTWIYQTIDGLEVGLQNPSFEQPIGSVHDWTATVYDYEGNVVRSGADACPSGLDAFEAQRRICRVEADGFEVNNNEYFEEEDVKGEGEEITVHPLDGKYMLRLGGPFPNANVLQSMDRYVAQQTFIVDPASPLLHLNYDMMTFDYKNYDELRLRVRLFDTGGEVVYNRVIGSFGPDGDTSFKSTGWRSSKIDLAPYAGEEVTMRIDSGGTQDDLFGFWTYIDAGTVPDVVSQPGPPDIPSTTPPSPGNPSKPVIFQTQKDANGMVYYNFAASSVSAFEAAGKCLTLKVPVPIHAGSAAVSNVSLLLNQTIGDSQQVPLEDLDGDETWTVAAGQDGICVAKGTLYVAFTLTENGISQDFVVPLGGVTLIDPQGIVYDKLRFESDLAKGMTADEARADAALGNVTVILQRRVGEGFQTVLSGDPGISPNVNPELTPASGPSKGLFQWDVSPGEYRVIASLAGYIDTTSKVVSIPPPVTDLHVALEPEGASGLPNPQAGSQTAQASASGPQTVMQPCAGKRGRALRGCKLRLRQRAARARCKRLRDGRRRARCMRHANAIGRKPPRGHG